jgi:hypothetical protein
VAVPRLREFALPNVAQEIAMHPKVGWNVWASSVCLSREDADTIYQAQNFHPNGHVTQLSAKKTKILLILHHTGIHLCSLLDNRDLRRLLVYG